MYLIRRNIGSARSSSYFDNVKDRKSDASVWDHIIKAENLKPTQDSFDKLDKNSKTAADVVTLLSLLNIV